MTQPYPKATKSPQHPLSWHVTEAKTTKEAIESIRTLLGYISEDPQFLHVKGYQAYRFINCPKQCPLNLGPHEGCPREGHKLTDEQLDKDTCPKLVVEQIAGDEKDVFDNKDVTDLMPTDINEHLAWVHGINPNKLFKARQPFLGFVKDKQSNLSRLGLMCPYTKPTRFMEKREGKSTACCTLFERDEMEPIHALFVHYFMHVNFMHSNEGKEKLSTDSAWEGYEFVSSEGEFIPIHIKSFCSTMRRLMEDLKTKNSEDVCKFSYSKELNIKLQIVMNRKCEVDELLLDVEVLEKSAERLCGEEPDDIVFKQWCPSDLTKEI